MPCSKQSSKMYTARPSPSRRSKDCKGQRRRGNDGRMWVSKKDSNGVYRWQRAATSPRKSKSPARRSPARGRKMSSLMYPSFHSGRACGTRTRADGRWTRSELERLAIAQGIPYDGVTMDALCETVNFANGAVSPAEVTGLLNSYNQVLDPKTGVPMIYGPEPAPFITSQNFYNQVFDPQTGLPMVYGPELAPGASPSPSPALMPAMSASAAPSPSFAALPSSKQTGSLASRNVASNTMNNATSRGGFL